MGITFICLFLFWSIFNYQSQDWTDQKDKKINLSFGKELKLYVPTGCSVPVKQGFCKKASKLCSTGSPIDIIKDEKILSPRWLEDLSTITQYSVLLAFFCLAVMCISKLQTLNKILRLWCQRKFLSCLLTWVFLQKCLPME